MKPPPFDYLCARSLEEATDYLRSYGSDARILAGGQSLIAMLNMRLTGPKLVVDISRLDGRNYIRPQNGHLAVGCSTTQASLERFSDLERAVPLVAKALPHVGHFQTRNKGTVCGSLAHADPSSELPLCASLLNAPIELRSRRRSRTVQARDFFCGLLQTVCQPEELIVEVRWPVAADGEGYSFREMAFRHGDFAIIAVAVRAAASGITIGIGGAASKPEVRQWPPLEGSGLADALNALAWELDCQDDAHATAAYRRHLIRELGRQAIEEARACLH